jgi:hypothetical protein
MADKLKKLSDTARALLTTAMARDDNLIPPPQLPTAAARQVARSLLTAGLAEEVPTAIGSAAYAWRIGEQGDAVVLRATALGITRVIEADAALTPSAPTVDGTESSVERTCTEPRSARRAVTLATEDPSIQGNRPSKHAQEGQNDPDGGEAPPATTDAAGPPEAATTSVGRLGRADSLRRAAQALLDAWGNRGDSGRDSFSEMTGPITALRAALGPNTSNGNLHPRLETKQAQVLAMLARDEGVSGPQIAKAMRLGAAYGPRLPSRPRQEGHQGRCSRACSPGRPR